MYRQNGHTIVSINLSKWLDTHNVVMPGDTALRAAKWKDRFTTESCWLYYCELYDTIDHQPEIFYDYHGPITGLLMFLEQTYDDFRGPKVQNALQRWFNSMSRKQQLALIETLIYGLA